MKTKNQRTKRSNKPSAFLLGMASAIDFPGVIRVRRVYIALDDESAIRRDVRAIGKDWENTDRDFSNAASDNVKKTQS